MAGVFPHVLSCPLGLFGKVALVIEVAEERDEAEGVSHHHHIHVVREVAVGKEVVGCVESNNEELNLQ